MLVTLDELKAQLNIDLADDSQDDELQACADAAAGAVEQYLHQVVEQRAVVDDVEVRGASFRLWSAPVISLTSVASLDGGTIYDVTGMHVSAAGVVRALSGPAPTGWVRVTYQAGYTTVPEQYKRGALVIIQHIWETQRGVGLVRGGVIGEEEAYDPRASYSIPRKALEWLGPPAPVVA